MAIVSYTWEELEKMPSYTDWERLKNMKDEDIDYSDIPPLTDEDFAKATRYGKPLLLDEDTAPQRISLSLQLTSNTLSAYRKMGKHWKSKLRANVEQYLNQQVAML